MLVLSRREGGRLMIGDNITVTVLNVIGRTVRLGISAPDNVSIMRSELLADPPTVAIMNPQVPTAWGPLELGEGEG